MATETQNARAQTMEAHKQALVDTALEHEQVIEFLEHLHRLLVKLERTDVEVITETRLENTGVSIGVLIKYDSLFPGQAAKDPERSAKMRQTETTLLNALKEEKIIIGTGFLEGGNQIMKSYYIVFRATVTYQGEILSAYHTKI